MNESEKTSWYMTWHDTTSRGATWNKHNKQPNLTQNDTRLSIHDVWRRFECVAICLLGPYHTIPACVRLAPFALSFQPDCCFNSIKSSHGHIIWWCMIWMISYAIQIRLGAVWCGAEKKLSLRGEMRMRELNYFSTIQSIQQVSFNHPPFHRSFGCKNRIIDIIFYSTVQSASNFYKDHLGTSCP